MAFSVHISFIDNSDLDDEVKCMVDDASHSKAEKIDWLDMDRAIARFCADHHIAVTDDINEKMDLHIRAIGEWTAKGTFNQEE
jgi:hypothetical protein